MNGPAPLRQRSLWRHNLALVLGEIGQDGTTDFGDLDLTFGGEPGSSEATSHEAGEATETPEVDSPLDD